ncbi:MAG: hypothetical protein ACRD4I_07740 [Candidatus Angelobacter sp.]
MKEMPGNPLMVQQDLGALLLAAIWNNPTAVDNHCRRRNLPSAWHWIVRRHVSTAREELPRG